MFLNDFYWVSDKYVDSKEYTHTHTHTYIYLYIYESKYGLKSDSMKIAEKHNPNR